MHRGRPFWLQAFRKSKHPLTWLSLLVMGSDCFRFRQFGKGLLYLLSELAFFRFFFGFGWKYLSHFDTLGENAQLKVWNEELQIYQRVPGDNSMLILLFSVLTIAGTILFVYLWYLNLKSAGELCLLDAQGKHIPSFREDLRSLLDSRFHITLLAAPMLSLVAFTVLPIVFMVLIAFTNYDSAHQPPGELFTWTGLTNVTDIFLGNQTKTHTFFGIFGWTIVWAILATFTNYILGMLLAILINHKLVKLKKMWRTLFVISIAIPQFVSLLLISRALEPMGAINIALMKLGWITTPLPFLTDKTLARICVVVINMWIGIPYTMLNFTGVLMNIPSDLYESAELDGAGPFRRFTSITLPYMIFVMTPTLITTFTSNINNFNVIYLLSGGGPTYVGDTAGQTDLLVTWLYKLSVDKQQYNLAAVIGIMTFVILAFVSLVTYRNSASYKEEGAFK